MANNSTIELILALTPFYVIYVLLSEKETVKS
jgi:hypothetical protein